MQSNEKLCNFLIMFFSIGEHVSSAQAQTMFLDHCLDCEIEFNSFLHDTTALILQATIRHLDGLC